MSETVVIRYHGSSICLENINEDEIIVAYKANKTYFLLTENSVVAKSLNYQSCSSVEDVIKIFHKFADENDIKIVSEEEFKKYELLK